MATLQRTARPVLMVLQICQILKGRKTTSGHIPAGGRMVGAGLLARYRGGIKHFSVYYIFPFRLSYIDCLNAVSVYIFSFPQQSVYFRPNTPVSNSVHSPTTKQAGIFENGSDRWTGRGQRRVTAPGSATGVREPSWSDQRAAVPQDIHHVGVFYIVYIFYWSSLLVRLLVLHKI